MKKIISVLLALLMITGIALAEPAAEQSAPLTYEELGMYLDKLVKAALESEDLTLTRDEDGVTYASFAGATLAIADEELTESTAVLCAELNPGWEDPRGILMGDTLSELLEAYPNDNPDLYGSYWDAALYIHGEKPEASIGYLLRDGQRVIGVDHIVESWTSGGVVECGVSYDLDQGMVTGIWVWGEMALLTEEEALESIAEVAAMQEITEYFAYPQSEDGGILSPFEREDLSFSGVDFLDITADAAVKAFGEPLVDEWEQDSNGEFLRLLQWDGVSLLLSYDAQKNFLRADSLTVTDDVLEGPRGVRVGDYMDSVIYRFRHSEGTMTSGGVILYGDGETAPYGLLTYDAEGAALRYAFSLEDGRTVIWYLTFSDALLQEMRLLLR